MSDEEKARMNILERAVVKQHHLIYILRDHILDLIKSDDDKRTIIRLTKDLNENLNEIVDELVSLRDKSIPLEKDTNN